MGWGIVYTERLLCTFATYLIYYEGILLQSARISFAMCVCKIALVIRTSAHHIGWILLATRDFEAINPHRLLTIYWCDLSTHTHSHIMYLWLFYMYIILSLHCQQLGSWWHSTHRNVLTCSEAVCGCVSFWRLLIITPAPNRNPRETWRASPPVTLYIWYGATNQQWQ